MKVHCFWWWPENPAFSGFGGEHGGGDRARTGNRGGRQIRHGVGGGIGYGEKGWGVGGWRGGMGPRCDEEWDTVAYTYLRDRA